MTTNVFDLKIETLIETLNKSTDPEKLAAAHHLELLAAELIAAQIGSLKMNPATQGAVQLLIIVFSPRYKELSRIVPYGNSFLQSLLHACQILGFSAEAQILKEALE